MHQEDPTKLKRCEWPEYVLWTRMQAEAGQALASILRRKERERKAGGGQFFWGVGNAPSRLIRAVAKSQIEVPVIFSRMKTRPKAADTNPKNTALWQKYIDCEGRVQSLPPHVLLTSRGDSAKGAKRVHYALQCYSDSPLSAEPGNEPFDHRQFRNAGGLGRPVGASQVTSLLTRSSEELNDTSGNYSIDMRAFLTGSYWVRLVDPLPLSPQALNLIEHAEEDQEDWLKFCAGLRKEASPANIDSQTPLLL